MIFTCVQITEMTGEFVNGELPEETAVHFEKHVVLCADCHLQIRSYRAVISIGRALPKRGPIPKSLEERLRALLQSELRESESK